MNDKSKPRYCHSVTLQDEEEERLGKAKKNGWKLIEIFRVGLVYAADNKKKGY